MKVFNRKARYNYEILEKIEAGISLTGPEVKSVKQGRIRLDDAFVRIKEGEAFLFNANIFPYPFAETTNYDPTRQRKLLLKKSQILSLAKKIEGKNLTLIPVLCYTKGRLIKIGVGLAKGKKKFEKRREAKKQEIEGEIARELKNLE